MKPELAPTLEPLYRQVLETGEPVVHNESTDEAGLRSGDRRHWLSSYYPVRAEDGGITGVGAVIMDVTRQRKADERLRVLAEAGELFASSLDADAVFARIAQVVVPRLADSISIFLAAGRSLERVACAHADPELQPLLEALPPSYAVRPDSPAAVVAVFERAESMLISNVSAGFYDQLARLGADRKLLDRIGSSSLMLVPLVARGESLGVLAIGSREPGRYSEDDLALAVELAGRAAVAVDNARLFREVSFRTTVLEAQQEASLDGLLLVSPDGRMLSYNARFAELWGFSEELVAAEDDRAALAAAMQKVDDPEAFIARVEYLYAHPEEVGREEILLKDGRVFDRYGAAVRGPDGHYYGWLWSFRDVTAAKQAEIELERRAEASRALEFVGDGVFLLDSEGVVRLWNPAAEAITGLREADVLARRLVDAIPAWADVERLAPVAERRHGGVVRAETLPLELDGREVWLSISGVAFGEGIVYAFRDLTEERAIERLKSDFVSTVSHELRTPLAAIYGAAMTLKREDVPLSPEQRDGMMSVVAGESERLARIVNDILLASRLDSDLVDVSIERADPAELVARCSRPRRRTCRRGSSSRARSRTASRRSRPTPSGFARSSSTSSRTRSSTRLTAGGFPSFWRLPENASGSRWWTRGSGSGKRARPDLREVLPGRPEPDPGRRRYGARPVHLPGDRPPDGRSVVGRVRGGSRLHVRLRASAGRLIRGWSRQNEERRPSGRLSSSR